MSSTELARHDGADLPSTQSSEAISQALEGLKAIRTFVKEQFKPGIDAGVIPGCGDKPTLFLPGAQKATMYFNAFPSFKVRQADLGGGHVEYRIRCLLISRATGRQIGEGLGCCSTMEAKYRYRKAERSCPSCGKPAIIKGKEEYGGGYVCFVRKGGCGAKFKDGHKAIESQATGQAENPDLHDVRNTVLKMAKKRAHVDAAMTLGCLSELFTQDIEDTYRLDDVRAVRPEEPEPYHVDGEIIEEPAPRQRSAPGLFGKEHVARTQEYAAWLGRQCDRFNARWHESWERTLDGALAEGRAVPEKVPDAINTFGANGHILKWARSAGLIDATIVPEGLQVRQMAPYAALVFGDHKDALKVELTAYFAQQARQIGDGIYRKFPDLAPDGWHAEQEEAARQADHGDAYEGDMDEAVAAANGLGEAG